MRAICAYCTRTGNIGFSAQPPAKSLVLAIGEEGRLKEIVGGIARHGWDDDLLVPGMPEAANDAEAATAASRFRTLIEDRLKAAKDESPA